MSHWIEFDRGFWAHNLFVMAVAVVILATSRAVGVPSWQIDLHYLAVNSVIVVVVSHIFQTILAVTAMPFRPERVPLWACALVGCIAAAIPSALVAPSLNFVVGAMPATAGPIETREQFFAFWTDRWPFITMVFATLGPLLWMPLNFRWWARRFEEASGRSNPSVPQGATVECYGDHLFDKLPPERRGQLFAISAEQHYVRVITSVSEDLILMSFSDAIAPFPTELGMRIHRSHWVSLAAVDRLTSQGNATQVLLRNGHALPVSRSYSGAVREVLAERLSD